MRANRLLPEGTLEAMIATLPSADDLVSEQGLQTPTRQAIAATTAAMHGMKADALLLNTVASAIVVGSLITAFWMRNWSPFLALGLLALLPVVRHLLKRRRQTQSDAEVAACRAQSGFNEGDYTRIQASLR